LRRAKQSGLAPFDELAELLANTDVAGSALEVVGLARAPPSASALKMAYAAWTKTTAA
jgi:hypothetical protein